MMKVHKTAALAVAVALAVTVHAQVNVVIKAPTQTIEGDQFRVSYVVNTQDIEHFEVGEFEGLIEMYGPSKSSSSSFSMVNGKTTSSSSITFTYTVQADKPGTYHLPVFTVESGGKTYMSASPAIEVLPAGNGSSGSSGSSGSRGQGQSGSSTRMHTPDVGERITGKDIFIAATASKKRIYEQEAVLITYKLYTLMNISEMSGKMPELDGCHVQQLARDKQPELKMEHYNGRNYGTVVWSQYVVFPQHSGTITIPEIKFEATIIQQNRSMDPFDMFFGGGSMVQEVHRAIMAPAVTLTVEPLPEPRPANFSGAVGKFGMESTMMPLQLDANDATTLRIAITGTGNMKLMKSPEVEWPKDFERYDPKQEDRTSIGTRGSSGTMLFDYIAVPRHAGKYEVPAVQFCYFDPEAASYKTLTTDAYTIEVAKGKNSGSSTVGSGLSKEDIEMLNQDIRYIKMGDVSYQTGEHTFFNSLGYWLIYILGALAFAGILVACRRQAIRGADIAAGRVRRANKVAAKRLRQARQLMERHDAAAFYEETMRALWGFVSDKMNIPLSELSRENVCERMAACQVSDELAASFVQALDDCEFARFAPGDPDANMDKIYASAESVINQMEGQLK